MSLIFVLPLSLILVLLAALLHQSHIDARVATVAGGYNASELATMRAHVRTRSHYYNVMRPDDHRLAVGGKWDEVGELQLRFLRAHGLLPEHRVLDLGCGALRAGIHLVRYLESGHYYGLDLNSHLINAGYERELRPLGLAAKLPLDHLKVSADFGASQFGVAFDFVIAHSVWTHLPLDEIGRCLRQVAPTLAPTGRFYATLHVAPENVSLSTTIVQHAPRSLRDPPRVVTHGDRDFFHVHVSDVAHLAHELGLEMRYLGAWGHPTKQKMVEFRHRGAAGDLPNMAATASGREPPARSRERAPANAHLPNLASPSAHRHRRLLRGSGAPSWAPPAAKGRRATAPGRGAPSWAPACAALGYPRSLRRVLPDAADREHLKRLYFEHVRGRSPYLTDAPLHANCSPRRPRFPTGTRAQPVPHVLQSASPPRARPDDRHDRAPRRARLEHLGDD